MRGWTKNPPKDPYRRFNWAMAKLCRVAVYLIETRDLRRKGTKLKTEAIIFDALQRLADELK